MGRTIAFALMVGCSGCSNVFSSDPMGETATTDLSGWEGVWSDGDLKGCPMRFDVADAEQGRIRVTPAIEGGPCASDDDGPEEFAAFVREAAGLTYVSVDHYADDAGRNDGPSDRFEWVLAERCDDVLRLRLPDVEAFAELVDQGLLPGVELGSDVLLLPLEHRDYDAIARKADLLFENDVVTLTRVTGVPAAEPTP